MKKNKTLQELFSFPGFKATKQLQGKFGDSQARIISLHRQKKQWNALSAINAIESIMITRFATHAIWMRQIIEYFYATKDDGYFACNAKAYAWNN